MTHRFHPSEEPLTGQENYELQTYERAMGNGPLPERRPLGPRETLEIYREAVKKAGFSALEALANRPAPAVVGCS